MDSAGITAVGASQEQWHICEVGPEAQNSGLRPVIQLAAPSSKQIGPIEALLQNSELLHTHIGRNLSE